MRIGIPAFPYDRGRSGIWSYIKNLITKISLIDSENEYYIFTSHDFKPDNKNIIQVLFKSNWINNPIVNILWHQAYLPYAVNRFKLDLLHLPAGNRRLILFKNCKIITTVHDLSQFQVENKYDALRMFYVKKALSMVIGDVDRIIAVSDNTKRDVLRYWKVMDDKITVIPEGIAESFLTGLREMRKDKKRDVLARYKIAGAYIFYVSRLEYPGKNHIVLIKAYDKLRASTALTHKLVLAGAGWNKANAIYDEAGRSPFRSDIIFTGYVPANDLPYLFSAAELFAFPSLHEGFGIPLLEAMACRIPIVSSNSSSMPELLDDCGLMFDPKDSDDMAEKMRVMLTNSELREQYIRKGSERIKAFDWEDIARRTIQIYTEM